MNEGSTRSESRLGFLIKTGLFGAARAFFSLPFEYPFDTIKTNMQSLQLSISKTSEYIFHKKGWRGFYSGFAINLLRVTSKQLYRWPLWIGLSTFYDQLLGKVNELFKQTVIGFSISFAELIVICPF